MRSIAEAGILAGMSPKRYYVLTAQGELGPHTRLELRELLRARKVQADDQLRTAFGKTVGTVAAILEGSEELSSYRTSAVEIEEPAALHPSPRRSRTLAPAVPETAARPFVRPLLLAVLGVVAIGAVLLLVRSGNQDASEVVVNPIAERKLPVLSLSATAAAWITGEPGELTIRLSQPSPVPVSVPIVWGGTATPGVDVVALVPAVEIPGDTWVVTVPVTALPASSGRSPAVVVTARLQGGPGWLLDPQAETTIPLRSSVERAATDPAVTWISDLPFVSEWNNYRPVQRDKSYNGNPLVLAGVTYPRGLGVHAGKSESDPLAHVTIRLAGAYDEFLTDIGIDAEAPQSAGVVFQVWVDGKPQFDSGLMRPSDRSRSLRIPVSGAGELKLIVLDGGNGDAQDHADWAGARLLTRR